MNWKALTNLQTPEIPRIMRRFETNKAENIRKMVENDELYGFVQCDIDASDEVIAKFSHINFPMVIRRETITKDLVGPYMNERMEATGRPDGVETVITSWTGKGLLLLTPLLKFYLKMGLRMSNVQTVIQYTPSKCFSNFINKCVQGRINSGSNKTRGDTFKICMNSS